jgi:septal ring factor EnvC (AmiA/AmiB activator)
LRRGGGAALLIAAAASLCVAPGAPALSDGPGARSILEKGSALPALPAAPVAAPGVGTTVVFPPLAEPAATPAGLETVPESAAKVDELAGARGAAIEAARQVRQRERALMEIQHEIYLLGRDIEAGRRGLAESRSEQERLLATILHLARDRGHDVMAGDAAPVARLRAEQLMRDAEPALRSQLRALMSEVARIGALQRRIAAEEGGEAAAQQALATERERLAAAVARRNALTRAMSPPESVDAALRIADVEREAADVADLIKRAEAAAEAREKDHDKERERTRTGRVQKTAPPASETRNPTRPAHLRSLAEEAGIADEARVQQPPRRQAEAGQPGAPLVAPVTGKIADQFGDPGARDTPNGGIRFNALPGGTVVAPFDGKVIYAGPFRKLGRVLIIRHDHLYYSLLAGLGRIDARLGDWVLAGEPVGAMPDIRSLGSGAEAPDPAEADAGPLLYFELRRDGRTVDPQPWLASVEDGRNERNGDQKVRQ